MQRLEVSGAVRHTHTHTHTHTYIYIYIYIYIRGCGFCEVDAVAQHGFVIYIDCLLCEVGGEIQEIV
jgi:hypothetical protein